MTCRARRVLHQVDEGAHPQRSLDLEGLHLSLQEQLYELRAREIAHADVAGEAPDAGPLEHAAMERQRFGSR